jgi:hypothetical protein
MMHNPGLYKIWVKYLQNFNWVHFGVRTTPQIPSEDTIDYVKKHHKNFRFCK